MNTDLSYASLLWMYALMLIPLGLFLYLQLGVARAMLTGLVRMSIQLVLVGLYL